MFSIQYFKLLRFSFIVLCAYFILSYSYLFLFLEDIESSQQYLTLTTTYGILAFVGAIIGLISANIWGSTKSVVGRALGFISYGLLFQFLGQAVYSYYLLVLNGEPPYPSIAELFFLISLVLFLFGTLYLSQVTQLGKSLESSKVKIVSGLVMLVLFVVSIWNFIINHDVADGVDYLIWGLEIVYPLLQSVFIGLAIISLYIMSNLFGGKAKWPIIIIILGLVAQYLGDTLFLWIPTYVSDGFYLSSFVLISIGLLEFAQIPYSLQTRKSENKGPTNG